MIIRSFLIVNKNPKYAITEINIDINCKRIVLQMFDNEYVIKAIIAQPISSGKMFLKISRGDKWSRR